MTFKVCLKKKYRTLITETTCRENACLFRETKHAFKNLGPEHDVVCPVSSFGLALRKSEGGFIGCGSFRQFGTSCQPLRVALSFGSESQMLRIEQSNTGCGVFQVFCSLSLLTLFALKILL